LLLAISDGIVKKDTIGPAVTVIDVLSTRLVAKGKDSTGLLGASRDVNWVERSSEMVGLLDDMMDVMDEGICNVIESLSLDTAEDALESNKTNDDNSNDDMLSDHDETAVVKEDSLEG